MASETVTVFLGGEPTLDDLAAALDALRDMLGGLTAEARRGEITWAVDALEKSSALASFRGVGAREDVEQVTGFYLATAQMMRDRKPVPSRVTRAAEKFLGLLDERVPEIRFETADDDVTISAVTQPPTTVQVLRPSGAHGAVEGRVQTLSRRGSLRFTLYDLVHDKPVRLLHGEPVGLGLGTIAQLVPFQRSTSVPLPTAKQLVALVHDTLFSSLLPQSGGLGLGLGAMVQPVPFQRSTSRTPPESPTAKQLVVLVHDTPRRTLDGTPDGFGLGTIAQLAPFHRSISVTMPKELFPESPTAKQLVALLHDTL